MPPSDAERHACRENLVPSIIAIYQYWQVIKCKPAQRIVGKKIGSNNACPCGSGKKFKKCCGE
ncbi:MAG: SEC-C domain-containing protein, partial [Neisseriaceae bacterium]|nr:SEC-C domain-containing protein [Neisseriaceae bacterium]